MTATAADAIRGWRADPVKFVRDVFKAEPDAWQLEVLAALPTHPRVAMKACKGPGKTAVLAWIVWWMLVCFLHPKIACTSITEDNLRDGLWTELAKWRAKSPLLTQAFSWTKTRIYANDHPETWWASARTWAKGADSTSQADTLAGLHADNLLFVIDEAGGVPDAVMAAAEAGLANADGETKRAWLVLAGNPTQLEGPLYRASTSERALWHLTEITADPDDPKRTPRVSVEWARQQIEKYGRDNPWVLVNVFGRFPPASINALLGPDDVSAAIKRVVTQADLAGAARIIGVDVARFGLDASVIARRHGRIALPLIVGRNLDSLQGAGWVAQRINDFAMTEEEAKHRADGVFIDNTGGYGAGWIDQLNSLRYQPVGVAFSGKADDPRYYNKRTEMHFRLAEWVKSGGQLPDDPELAAELTAMTYVFKGDKLWVEEKEQVREKLGRSPDRADALALTFAYPVSPAATSASLSAAVRESYLTAAEQRGDPYNPLLGG